LSVCTLTSQQDSRCTSGACYLCTLARKHFDAVNSGTHGYVADGQRVACADGSIQAGQQGCTNFQAARSDDVATLAVGIAQQCDMRSAVGVVFKALDLGRDAVFVATEIDQAVVL